MTPTQSEAPRDHPHIDAWLFDLDGVLTDTARLHARAWKDVLDGVLRSLAARGGPPFVPFDPVGDYARFIDGMPRDDGVRRFLAARRITLPDDPGADPAVPGSVQEVSAAKNDRFEELLAREGVEEHAGARAAVTALRAAGARTAVVSSSTHAVGLLTAAGLDGLVDLVLDGRDRHRLGLAGKPAPDTFLHAAQELGVAPARAAVVEDALAGVEAGRAGGFGLVVGVTDGDGADLRAHGADAVVGDLRALLGLSGTAA